MMESHAARLAAANGRRNRMLKRSRFAPDRLRSHSRLRSRSCHPGVHHEQRDRRDGRRTVPARGGHLRRRRLPRYARHPARCGRPRIVRDVAAADTGAAAAARLRARRRRHDAGRSHGRRRGEGGGAARARRADAGAEDQLPAAGSRRSAGGARPRAARRAHQRGQRVRGLRLRRRGRAADREAHVDADRLRSAAPRAR